MRAVIRYPGSKWRIANWIISHFPEEYEKLAVRGIGRGIL